MQTRGPIWKEILDAIDSNVVTEDFEEMTTTDQQWDDWFSSKYPSVALERFKVDVYLVLPHKVGWGHYGHGRRSNAVQLRTAFCKPSIVISRQRQEG